MLNSYDSQKPAYLAQITNNLTDTFYQSGVTGTTANLSDKDLKGHMDANKKLKQMDQIDTHIMDKFCSSIGVIMAKFTPIPINNEETTFVPKPIVEQITLENEPPPQTEESTFADIAQGVFLVL